MTDLYFWAQSLDNQSPDEFFKNGLELSDAELQQNLVSEIYALPKSNIKVLSANAGVTMRYSYPKFVIEAIPTQQDTIQRFAPVVIYGVLQDVLKDEDKDVLYDRIVRGVSDKLKRELDHSTLEAINKGLSELLNHNTLEVINKGFSKLEILNNKNPRFQFQFLEFILEAFSKRIPDNIKQAFKKIKS